MRQITAIAPASSTRDPTLDTLGSSDVLGGWRLVRKLAESRWFVVHLASPASCDPDWPADYVLKLVRPTLASDPRLRQLLRRETQVSQEVVHPQLATVLDADLENDPAFVVQPYYEGRTVRELLNHGALSTSRSLWIARQVCEAFSALHQRQWLHGDIKPDNVIISPHGHATLLDLGFARRIAPQARQRADASLQTTLGYAAPELFLPQSEPAAGSDVYSLGVMLFEMLTGGLPFETADPHQLARHHLYTAAIDPRRLNANIPANVARLVLETLHKNAAARPTSPALVRQLVTQEIDCFALR